MNADETGIFVLGKENIMMAVHVSVISSWLLSADKCNVYVLCFVKGCDVGSRSWE